MMLQFRRYLAPVADIFVGETLGSVAEATTYLDVFSDCAADLWLSVTLEDRDPVDSAPRLRSGEPLSFPNCCCRSRACVLTPCFSTAASQK